MTRQKTCFRTYRLSDRYDLTQGRVFLTGTQALVRIMLDQARRDRAVGLNTAGFVSGYRGSPLGALDREFWQARDRLLSNRINFLPAINEDLGATAVLGAQQAVLAPDCAVEGVFSMWYGKGPGVDRSGDALKHGNAYGSSAKGGVLAVAGDDHGCVSSSMPHQSDVAFMAWFMPILNPASISEYLLFGEYGFALSRFSGIWVGFKAISETVEARQSVELRPARRFVKSEFTSPPGGVHVRLNDLPSTEIETRIAHKLAAVEAFVEANPIDRRIYDIAEARFGIVTTGKGHLDLMEAMRLLGLNEAKCRKLGIDIFKVGLVWPLARRGVVDFVRGKREILVVEEKRGLIESQIKNTLYDCPPHDRPERIIGKYNARGDPLIPWTGELSPLLLVPILAGLLERVFPDKALRARADALTATPPPVLNVSGAARAPYFCSGCPHNISTKVPQGSMAASGIGCHVMAAWMDRHTMGYAQMGGEGVPWVATSAFAGNKHMFQNLGEGTWYHSGSLAIRQAVAAKTNITYKILYNDAVAMTGGQPVDGPISVSGIAQSCRAEGIGRIAVVSDDPAQFDLTQFPAGTTLHHRAELDGVQRELREIEGVTIIIYQQGCATEKRRLRKRGKMEDPKRFVVINDLVCEGCGDCSLESNCLSVEPKETVFGRKRRINLSTCNKDFSCLNGFCPSFVTIEGGRRRNPVMADLDIEALVKDLPQPEPVSLATPYNLLVAGVGGTGIITLGALIAMAAHIEGKGASVLDFTGFAQKFGTVIGHVRLGGTPDAINQLRIEAGAADAVIGCDVVVCSAPKASAHYRAGSRIILNRAEMPTGDLVLNRDADLRVAEREALIRETVGDDNVTAFDANAMAERLMGDCVFANTIMLGAAWQKGLVPVSETALKQAILLNGIAVENNALAFDLGRVLAETPERLQSRLREPETEMTSLKALIEHRARFLAKYQDRAYAERYRSRLAAFGAALPNDARERLVTAAAKSLFKLMAYKDEYEIARLYTRTGFEDRLKGEFEGPFAVKYHFAPPLLPLGKDARGRPRKRAFSHRWMTPILRILAGLKGLRGGVFDPFAYSKDRRLDRALMAWFEELLDSVALSFKADDFDTILAILSAPMEIRGYGPVREKAAKDAHDRVSTMLGEIGGA